MKRDERYELIQWKTLGCLIPAAIVLWLARAFFHHLADG
jgi:hypothetical protein